MDLSTTVLNKEWVEKNTPNLSSLKVRLEHIPGKGIGLIANRNINRGEIVSYYKVMVYISRNHVGVMNDAYNIQVVTKSNRDSTTMIGDIYEGSNAKPRGTIPYWAYFSNEPSEGQKSNSLLDINLKSNYRNRHRVKIGDTLVYSLKAKRNIKEGEEIVWYYGTKYVRNYNVGE